MTQHLIYSNKFYILSGPSASGKSSLTRQLIAQGLPLDAIISTDSIRKQILGSSFSTDDYGIRERLNGWEINQPEIFKIIDQMLTIRFKQNLPTFLDATNLDDSAREPYALLAKKHGIESHVVIFNVNKDDLKDRLSKRPERFDFSVVEKQLEKFSLTSSLPHSVVTSTDTFLLLPNLLTTKNIDVVGDVHGLLNETILLLNQTGWFFDENKLLFTHPNSERKVLFLGDAVDRGIQSIDFIKAVKNTVKNGQGLFVLGNHEAKLMGSFEQYKEEGIVRAKSLSSAQTVLKFLALNEVEQEEIYQFLLHTPTHYSLWINKNTSNPILTPSLNMPEEEIFKIAFAHADNDYYHPYSFPRSNALFGRRKVSGTDDMDTAYEKNYDAGLNKYIYLRGHTINFSQQNHIYSLEADQAFAGYLVSLDLEKYIQSVKNNNWESTHQLFEDNIVKQKSEFDFNKEIKSSVELMKKMDSLVKDGLVTDGWRKDENGHKTPNPDGIKIYKYSKRVHFKKLWKTEPLLEKARGLAVDIAGNIVIHPFDKLYNYGEYNTGSNVTPDQKVQMVDKLNGFLGCISKHPFKNELLLSTTGSVSLTSEFIGYISELISENTKHILLEHFKTNKQTLMFEVIHPKDQHIIEYDSIDHGLWLIGARGLNINDSILTESQLDALGEKLKLKRPTWKEVTFKEVLDILPSSELEGYMIRDANTNEPLMKIKTNYYLVTKFIGRIGPKMRTIMYKNPEKFKETHMDEEFYPLIDTIVASTPKEVFEAMTDKDRVDFVRNIINTQREEVVLADSELKSKILKI